MHSTSVIDLPWSDLELPAAVRWALIGIMLLEYTTCIAMGRSRAALKQLRKVQKANKRRRKKVLKVDEVPSVLTNEGGEESSDVTASESALGKRDAGHVGGKVSNSEPCDHSELTIELEKAQYKAARYSQDARLERIRADRVEEECRLRMRDAGNVGGEVSNSEPCDHCELTIELEKAQYKAARYARLERIRADRVEEECRLRIRQVRCFWRDKIYRECTRSGKMLKKAIQGPS
jgi:hypothetical protein